MIKICFDAGHGGNDPGAVANGMKEKDITLAVCLKLEEKLKAYNDVEVYLTRRGDVTHSLTQKSNIVNNISGLTYSMSVHVNAAGGVGAETYIQSKTGKAYDYALIIQDEYIKYTGAKNRGVKTANLHMNREVKANSCLIELAFIDSPSNDDISLLKNPEKMAEGIVKGLVKCFNLKLKNTSSVGSSNSNSITNDNLYRVRKSWNDVASQKGAYKDLNNAINECKKYSNYKVFDGNGNQVYPEVSTSFLVKVTADVLNVRSGAGTSHNITTTIKKNEVYTIVETKNNWGKLKSGAGWICLDYTVKC